MEDYKGLPFGASPEKCDRHYADYVSAKVEKTLQESSEIKEISIPGLEDVIITKSRYTREEDVYTLTGHGIYTEFIFNITTREITGDESFADGAIEGSFETEHQKRIRVMTNYLNPPPVGTQEEMEF